jgi:hypothetical protein
MKTKNHLISYNTGLMLIFSTLWLSIQAQSSPYNYQTYQKVNLLKATEARLSVSMVAGELNVESKDIPQLLWGEFLYDDPVLGEPNIEYKVDDHTGWLRIENIAFQDVTIDDDEEFCEWNLKLNQHTPLDMQLKMGFGEGNLMLENAKIRSLDYSIKAGKVTINLRNTSLPFLSCKAFAGEATVNLGGVWNNDLHANITGGAGNLFLVLPDDCNLYVEVNGIIGKIDAPRFERKENVFIRKTANDVPSLDIDVTGGIGNVYLEIEYK